MKKLKIAQIASLTERIPPRMYGGTERVVHRLTEGLVKRGHDVTLFASGDAVTSARLDSVCPRSLRDSGIVDVYEKNTLNLMNIGNAYSKANDFDIIHDHNGILSLPTAQLSDVPVVFTLHGAVNETNAKIMSELRDPGLVSISMAQRQPALDLNYVANIYNGLDLYNYPFSHMHEDYMLFVGRISPEKGVHHAIKVAQKLNKRLILAAKVDARDQEYLETKIKPYLNDKIIWIGEVNETVRNILMSKAEVFIHPVTWPEPFGLTLIESMACGCPVVAFALGSIPEVIQDGKTGFVVKDEDEMCEAVKNISTINRYYCSQYAKARFNEDNMVDSYIDLYYNTIYRAKYEKTEILSQTIIMNKPIIYAD
jgi:glycosyltransferase involved in cell wall biosynthesis